MDTLGNADEMGDDEYADYAPARRSQVMSQVTSTETLAIAALVVSVCSFFASGFFQFLYFVVSGPGDGPTTQYLVSSAPTALFSAIAVALGVTVARRPADRWTAGLAGAGLIVGGLGIVITVVGAVLVLTLGEPLDQGF
jgi:hypothetical protein